MPTQMRRFVGAAAEWNAIIAGLPNPHLLQTWEWAQVKAAYGWTPVPLIWEIVTGTGAPVVSGHENGARPPVAAAMVLKRQVISRSMAARLSILYAPKAPLLDWKNEALRVHVLHDLESLARKERAIFLKLDPDVVLGTGVPGEADARDEVGGGAVKAELERRGWQFAPDQIQFRNTVIVNLDVSESELLEHMKQKMRYNVRLAQKKGVAVRPGAIADLPALYRMYAETSARDGFAIRDENYYTSVWETFMGSRGSGSRPWAESLVAEVEGEPVAAIFVFYFAERAYYLYGMSREAHRDKMPNHLLQWEVIKRAKRGGCRLYDLWGAPDDFNEKDPLWGVFRFKQGLGGEVVRTLGAWDFPASPTWYRVYTRVMPRVLDLMRRRGKQKVRRDLAAA